MSWGAKSDELSLATPAGLEPAISDVTGRRLNQLDYGAKTHLLRWKLTSMYNQLRRAAVCVPEGIRTLVADMKGQCPNH